MHLNRLYPRSRPKVHGALCTATALECAWIVRDTVQCSARESRLSRRRRPPKLSIYHWCHSLVWLLRQTQLLGWRDEVKDEWPLTQHVVQGELFVCTTELCLDTTMYKSNYAKYK